MPLDQVRLIPALRARWRVVVLTWLAFVVAVLALTLALPARYESTATVVVEMGGADPIRGQAVFKPAGSVSTHIATQVDIMRSEQVARGALRSLGLHEQPKRLQRWREDTGGQGDFEAWLADMLLRKLAVQPSRDSNVVKLSYTSPDRHFAAAVVNAFVKSYVDTTLQMQVGPARQFNTFFEARAKPLREALEQAKARLSAYEKEHGLLVTAGDTQDVESARLAELTTQLVAVEDQVADASNRQRLGTAAPGRMGELRKDPEVLALTGELAKQEASLTQLRSAFGEQHPAVAESRQAIKVLSERIDTSMRRAAVGLDAAVKVTRSRRAEMLAAIERQRAVVLQRKSQRDAAAALLRDVDNAQKAYDAVLDRASQTALEGANTTQANISVVKTATPPAAALSLLKLNLSVAMLLGLLLGIARALLAERRDRRLRTVEDVTRWLQQPLLLALPDGAARRRRAARRSAETRQRLVASRPRLFLSQ